MRPLLTASVTALILAAGLAPAQTPFAAAPAAAQTASVQTESERLNAWFETKYEEMLQFSPQTLTEIGRKDLYDRLDDYSIAGQDEALAWYADSVAEMEDSFAYDALDAGARLSFDLWKYDYGLQALQAQWRGNDYVFNQMGGMHTELPTFLIRAHVVDTAEDMEAYIARVAQFDRALGQLVDRAESNAEGGVRPPYFAYDAVIGESKKLIDGAPFTDGEDTALWQDGKAKIDALAEAGTIDAAEADSLRADLRAALTDHYKPGYERLIAFMEADRPNAPTTATGVGALPDGEAYYRAMLHANTTTDLTADEIHQLGLEEIARIRAEMEAIMAEVGFDGDLQAFFEHVKTADWNYYPDNDAGADAYIADATAAIENIKAELPNYFGLLPKADLVVRRVEPYREQDGAAQHYFASTPDGSRPGIYYAHLSDMTAMPKNLLEVIAYHEGLPGHHMQIAIAQELEGVPTFQTQRFYTAYGEGWALYSEKLAKEMPNTYEDPYSDFGRLTSEIWRAIRLVVDTGLHAKGWTEAEAIEFFAANSPMPLETITSEVQRYIVLPGQATSYKVGMISIQQARARAEAALGPDFDIGEFHDVVLGGGALPLSLLEARVDGWIAAKTAP